MNLNEMLALSERVYEFRDYMRSFYSLDYDGIYAEEHQFTDEEIINGINCYIKNEENYKNIMKYGADTVDRECVRDIIENMRCNQAEYDLAIFEMGEA